MLGLLVALAPTCRSEALLGREPGGLGGAQNSDAAASGASAVSDGSTTIDSGSCVPRPCEGRVLACGDCLDNDGDGPIDAQDLECLGACDDDEESLHTGIPGQNQALCRMDCFFDGDSGGGNDGCIWDHRCDPLSIGPDYPPSGQPMCEFDPTITVGTQSCDEARAMQSDVCQLACLEQTPDGCDCFGCCELPARSGNFVWVGKELGGSGSCEIAMAGDPASCPPCTPVPGCQNPCTGCERCVGEQVPPATCAPPGDAGP